MRRKTIRGAWLLAAFLALAPAVALGQSTGPDYAPPDCPLPIPLGSTRPEDGGLFLMAEFTYFRWNNPLQNQPVAMHGFLVSDNSVQSIPAGTFVGSGVQVLNVNQLTGADSYQPGFSVGVGWKFGDSSAVTFSYMRLTEASYRAAATGASPQNELGTGNGLADSFLYAPVYNFPPQLAGAANKVFLPVTLTIGQNTVTTPINSVSSQFAFGAWNGATVMTESYLMRFQQWDITYRQVVYETDELRFNGVAGFRHDWIWDRYQWRSTTFSSDGQGDLTATPDDIAQYTNIISNSMWGVDCGCQVECYLGHGLALMGEARASILMDAVEEDANYDTLDKFAGQVENKRAKRLWTPVPEIEGRISLMWYPWENVQIEAGYELMAYFNTISSPQPIDFNYGNIDPHYAHTIRFFDGFRTGLSISF